MCNKPDAIVFFDLDGTLFTSDVKVTNTTLQSIKKLKENNIIPIISTGRTVCEVELLMDEVGIDSIIAMNGQSVFYCGENIFSNDIDKSVIDKVLSFSQQDTGVPLSFYNDKLMRVSEYSEPVEKFYHYIRQNKPKIDSMIHYHHPIQMLLLLCEQGEAIYRETFPELTFIRNTPYCVDVFNAGGSKGNGIKKLLENKGFSGVPTYAFGDGMNDFEMFETVDHPIAMANGVEKLKAIAEFVTDTNDNDGIAKGLKKFGLI